MLTLSLLGSLLLSPLLATCPTTGQEGAEAASEFGAPLFVDGERISDLEIKRFLSFGIGSNQTNEARFGRIIEIELDMREAAGDDLSKYKVTPEESKARFAREIDDFKLKFPTLDVDTEIARSFLSTDLYIAQLESAMLFDKLFFQDNPEEWPELTVSLITMEYGEEWVEDAKQSYLRRKKAQATHELDYLPADDPIFVDALRSVILEGLNDFYIIETDKERVAPGVLMSVEGLEVPVDEIFLRIQPYLRPDHIADAKQWLVTAKLIENYAAKFELSEEHGGGNALIPQAEYRLTFASDNRSWDQELKQYDMVALQVMGFPSIQAYGEYMRLSDSFARTIRLETDDDEILRGSLRHTNQITGAAKATCEAILISAFDFPNNVWKEGGWEWAEKHAAEVKKMLDEGAEWNDTLEHHSEFWDPPIPDVGHTPQFGRAFKGKFGQQTRNQISGLIGESEYRAFMYGELVTDKMFFDQERGTIAGPTKGPMGYYITRMISKSPPITPLNLNEPVHRDIAVQYYVRAALNAKSQELLAAAQVDGSVKGL